VTERSTKPAEREAGTADADRGAKLRSYRQPSVVEADSPLRLALILSWGLAGPTALILLAAQMLHDGTEVLSLWTLAYLAVLVLSVVFSFIDIRFFAGCTLTGRRATRDDWLSYSIALGVSALILWSFVQVLQAAIAMGPALRLTPFVTPAQREAACPTPGCPRLAFSRETRPRGAGAVLADHS